VAPDVREITLSAPSVPFEYAAGQWVSLHLPIGEHPPLVRAYTLASLPGPNGELKLCLDRVPDGLGSDYLFGLGVGDTVEYSGPLGRFVLDDPPGPQLWLARYTGIVPFHALLLELSAHREAPLVTLLYSAPTQQDLAYLDEIRALAERHDWLRFETLLDEPEADPVSQVAVRAAAALAEQGEVTPMICGKREFVRPLRDFFTERGWDRRDVKVESYD
jgi:ferredoxin-NADP reductase